MNELNVLFPDREIIVAGEPLLVRELRFAEQIRCQHLLQPLADALAAGGDAMDGADGVNRVYDLLASQGDAVIELVAVSCGRDPQWVQALPAAEGENLLLTWWGVNSGFFVRRAMRPKLVELARMQAAARQDGAPSSPNSLLQDMPPSDSANTPSDS